MRWGFLVAKTRATAELYINDATTPDVARVDYAHSWTRRLVGLLGRRSLSAQEGLWIRPCDSVHTIGMRFAIDVVFLDEKERVVRIARDLRRFRIARARARSVLELQSGAAQRLGLNVGDQLRFRATDERLTFGESLA